jgi:hypothetical protein
MQRNLNSIRLRYYDVKRTPYEHLQHIIKTASGLVLHQEPQPAYRSVAFKIFPASLFIVLAIGFLGRNYPTLLMQLELYE